MPGIESVAAKAVRELDFGLLPPHLRDRIALSLAGKGAPVPLVARRARVAGKVQIWAATAIAGALVLLGGGLHGFGDLYHPAGLQPWSWATLYSGGAALVAAGVLLAVEIFRVRGGAPFLPGGFLFPLDLVETSGRRLRLTSLATVTGVVVRDHRDGGRELVLSFSDRTVAVLVIDREDPAGLVESAVSQRRPLQDPAPRSPLICAPRSRRRRH